MEDVDISPRGIAAVAKPAVPSGAQHLDVARMLRETSAQADGRPLPEPVPLLHGLDGFVMDGLLSPAECNWLLRHTEQLGYSFWDARAGARKDFRNADTVEVFHPDLASLLWSRLQSAMSAPMVISSDQSRWQRDIEGEWEPCNTNEHVLFARYREGGHFSPHTDGFNIIDMNKRSMYTLIVYLNMCSSGGQTRFYAEEARSKLVKDEQGRFTSSPDLAVTAVDPVCGRALVFHHDLVHEGVPVGGRVGEMLPFDADDEQSSATSDEPVKYIIRSDVMFDRVKPICDSPSDREAFKLYMEAQELSNSDDARDIERSMQIFRRCFKMSPALADVYGM